MDLFVQGFQEFFTLQIILLTNLGVLIGIIFGAIPGLTASVAIVLILPMTYAFSPIAAISMLLGIYCGGQYGGSISAILLGVPGTNSAAATLLDGYPLAKQGKATKATLMALYASTIGGLVSAFALLFLAPSMAKVALFIAPPEYFVLAIFGLTIIAGVSEKSLIKGILSGCLGMLIAIIGVDQQTGVVRFGFNSFNLYNGLGMLTIMFGAFAFPNLFRMIGKKLYERELTEQFKLNNKEKLTKEEIKPCVVPIIKGSIVGTLIGAMPGTGAAIAAYLNYNNCKNASKNGEQYGKGCLEGVAAPESANNATTASSFIPLFTLGIPGTVAAATLTGALSMHGLTPGPGLFRNHGVTMYAIMIGLIIINIFIYLQGKYLAGFLLK